MLRRRIASVSESKSANQISYTGSMLLYSVCMPDGADVPPKATQSVVIV